MVCPHKQGGRRLSQCGHLADKGERVNFSRFARTSFMDSPLSVCFHPYQNSHNYLTLFDSSHCFSAWHSALGKWCMDTPISLLIVPLIEVLSGIASTFGWLDWWWQVTAWFGIRGITSMSPVRVESLKTNKQVPQMLNYYHLSFPTQSSLAFFFVFNLTTRRFLVFSLKIRIFKHKLV